MAAPPVDLVRRALQRAVEIARDGAAERPPVPAPVGLRPVLRFRRLPPAALLTVAQVLDTDEEFRARVVAAADRDDVGRVAWLWLTRPEGWQEELVQLVDELAIDDVGPAPEREGEKSLRRKLEGAHRAAARAAEQAERADTELALLRQEAAELRDAQAASTARIASLEREVEQLAAQRNTAVADLKRLENVLARRAAEKRDLEAQLAARRPGAGPSAGESPAPDATRVPHPPPAPDVDVERLRAGIEALEHRAAAFSADIGSLRALLPPHATTAPGARAAAPAAPRRRPLPIPFGLTDDSGDAALHLVGRPRAVLLVDGYNVSMAAWPGLEIAEQRARVERLLTDLVARNAGLTVELVFDGAEVLPLARPGARRARGVTVRFTPPDVEADDELLAMIDRYPIDRPVIVASDDRRVRDGSRRAGANVISTAQVMAITRA